MKSLINTSPTATQKYPLSFQDIENALFLNKNPEFKVYPFSYKNLRKTSLTFEVPFINIEELSLKLVFSNIKKINNIEVTDRDKNKMPLVLVSFLLDKFFEAAGTWREYILDNITEFCDTEISIINWKTVQNGGVQNVFIFKPTTFQKLWVSINAQKDRDFWLKTATDIRESLLPWMNYNLWVNIEKNKVNKKENVAYTEQRKALVEDRIEDLDKQKYNEEDLDIIK